MSTTSVEVQALLNGLGKFFNDLMAKDTTTVMSARVCGNIIYGFQNCSCTNENVKKILQAVLKRVEALMGQEQSLESAEGLPAGKLS